MALSKEEDMGLVSMPPFGPWSRFHIGWSMERSLVRAWLGWSSHGLVFSMLFSVLFYTGTSLSCVKAFLTDCRG